ncbi:hypothetical protein TcG_11072 [Trypanosoma cruzi]|nr:hypothetical protein TcG_11072 [Trypanosoma cruzi]
MRLLPALRQAYARPADHKEPSVSVVSSLSLPRRPARLCLRRNLFHTKIPQLLADQRAADLHSPAQPAAECARLSTVLRHISDVLGLAFRWFARASHAGAAIISWFS